MHLFLSSEIKEVRGLAEECRDEISAGVMMMRGSVPIGCLADRHLLPLNDKEARRGVVQTAPIASGLSEKLSVTN